MRWEHVVCREQRGPRHGAIPTHWHARITGLLEGSGGGCSVMGEGSRGQEGGCRESQLLIGAWMEQIAPHHSKGLYFMLRGKERFAYKLGCKLQRRDPVLPGGEPGR